MAFVNPNMVAARCWLAVTSRFPDTLQRDDLVDRTLILPVGRIGDEVMIVETRPLSRNKRWRVRKVLREAALPGGA